MAQSIPTIVKYGIATTKANQLYLASLGEYLAEHEDFSEIQEALTESGRDWYSDKMVASRGWSLVDDTGLSCPAMWAKGFLSDLKKLSVAIEKTESETFRIAMEKFGEGLKASDLRDWTPETETESNPLDNIERAITMLLNETPKIDAMALEGIRVRLSCI